MKTSWMHVISLVLALSLCFLPAAALAFNHYAVNPEEVKAIEKEDTFDVRITRKTVTNGAGGELSNPDVLTFDITNSSPYKISEVVIQAVATNEEGKAVKIEGSMGLYSMSMGKDARRLLVFSWPVSAAPGAVFQVMQPCSHLTFTGIRAIVSQYTTADGQVFENPLFAAWSEAALGSPTHILD